MAVPNFMLLLFSFERLVYRVWSFEKILWVLEMEEAGRRTQKGL